MKIRLYTDDFEYDITQYCTDAQVQIGLYAPYQTAQIGARIPYEMVRVALPHYLDTGAIDLDTWIMISDHIEHEGTERAIFLGRISAVAYGIEAHSEKELAGLVTAPMISISAQSFLAPLIESQLYLSAKQSLSGHIYDVRSYGQLLQRSIKSAFNQSRNVGSVLRTLYGHLARPYRLPRTLAGGATLDAIPIIHTRARAREFAPERETLFRSVFGLALNASHVRPTGAPWSVLTALFDADPSIIELYPSLEPQSASGAVSKATGSTPVIMYRLKPFVFNRINNQEVDPEAPQVQEHARGVNLKISAHEIIRVGYSIKSADRTNGAYVDTPLNASRGVDPFGILGRPTLDREDIDRAGLRLYRGQWPFIPTGRSTAPSALNRELQYIIGLVDQITRDNHRYLTGTATIKQRLDIRAGQWIKLEIRGPETTELLICYIETVTHRTIIYPTSVIEKRSTLSFTRGFFQRGEP
jgi:hypothetical protein